MSARGPLRSILGHRRPLTVRGGGKPVIGLGDYGPVTLLTRALTVTLTGRFDPVVVHPPQAAADDITHGTGTRHCPSGLRWLRGGFAGRGRLARAAEAPEGSGAAFLSPEAARRHGKALDSAENGSL